jgi:hypothetical protein
MIEHDIQNNVDATGMGFVDQLLEFLFGSCQLPVGGKSRVEVEEVLDGVAVVVVLPIRRQGVLQDRGKPDGTHSQVLQIGELALHSFEAAALTESVFLVPG